MANISEDAYDLLQTIKKRGRKFGGTGTFFDKSDVAYWYHDDSDENLLDTSDMANIDELLQSNLARPWQDEDGQFVLTTRGENYTHISSSRPTQISNTYGDIIGSNVANMSPGAKQSLDLSSYSVEIQKEVAELHEAVKTKDDTRAKRIIDGLWVSAPQLVLTLLQIGLSVRLGAN